MASGPFLPVALESDATLEIREKLQTVGGATLKPLDAQLFNNAQHGEVLLETCRTGDMNASIICIDFGDETSAQKAVQCARKAATPPDMYLTSFNQIVILCLAVKAEDQAAVTQVVRERFRAKGID